MDRISHGQDPDAPFISYQAFGGYGELPVPPWLSDEVAKAAMATLKVCRERALAVAAEHRETIVALARIVYAERRLTDRAPIEALQSVGLDPLPLRP